MGERALRSAEQVARPETWVAEPPVPDYTAYRVAPGEEVDLSAREPGATGVFENKAAAKVALAAERDRIRALQERLYAERRQSLLVVLQAMDTGGKDGTIKKVFRAVNPQGCVVSSFKVPTELERAHDFLWRVHPRAPARGMIGIFNRSHYEDVLIVRVKGLAPEPLWRARYARINEFERLLATQGDSRILKIFLHISKEEQKARLQARLDNPDKHWKFSLGDLKERALWPDYIEAYEAAMRECSTAYAPWYVVPANHKWYRNVVIARLIADTLAAMAPEFPENEDDLSAVRIED